MEEDPLDVHTEDDPPGSGYERGPPPEVDTEEDPPRSGHGRGPPPRSGHRRGPLLEVDTEEVVEEDQLRSTAGQAGGMP